MKQIFVFLFTFTLCLSLFASSLIDEEGRISPSLLSLCELLDVPHTGTPKEISQHIKVSWWQLGERWNFKPRSPEKESSIHALLEEMGCFNPVIASQKDYDYAFILGSLTSKVRKRIRALLDEWNRGVRWNTIVFLTGNRPLHPQKESLNVLLDSKNNDLPFCNDWVFHGPPPETELEMMLLVWEQADLPQEIRNLPIIIIDAPSFFFRHYPRTESSILKWLKMNPSPGSCIAFSSQPFVGYQHAIFVALLPPSFSIETVGHGGGREFPTSVLLDTIAKRLYREVRQWEKSQAPER